MRLVRPPGGAHDCRMDGVYVLSKSVPVRRCCDSKVLVFILVANDAQ